MKRIPLLIIAMIMLFSACGIKNNESTEKNEICIGFSMATLNEERWLCDKKMLINEAEKHGCTLISSNANGNSEQQYKDVVKLVDKGIDVLIYVPQSFDGAAQSVEYAKKKGIPVISYDRLAGYSDVDVYISFDNVKTGRLQAEQVLKSAPDGEYLIIKGPATDKNSRYLYEGAVSVLRENGISEWHELEVDKWSKEEACGKVLELFEEKTDRITGIIAANDSLAWGAENAVTIAGLTGKIAITGQDADLTACRRIIEGTQIMTVYKPIDMLAAKTVEICLQLAANETVTASAAVDNGYSSVPEILLDVTSVTSENIDDVLIGSGFYSREDLYG